MFQARKLVLICLAVLMLGTVPSPALAVDSSFLDLYRSYEQVTEELQLLAVEHGDIVSVISIGQTHEGQDIWAVKVSDNPLVDEDEPELLFTGAHHAKEWPGVEVVMTTIHLLVDSYGKTSDDTDGDGYADSDNDRDGLVDEDPFDGDDNDGDGAVDEDWSEARLSWLVDNRQIWFVPVLNPDGLEYCRQQVASGVTSEGDLWRKNREPNYQDFNSLEGLTYGVDINRNYGYHWGELGAQSPVNSAAEDYIGPLDKHDDDGDRRLNEDPMDNRDNDGDGLIDEDGRGGFSSLETIAIRDLVEEHEFVIAMNFHTYTGSIYWPWMFTLQLPADEVTYKELAKEMHAFNGYTFRDMSERNQQTFSRHPPVDGDSNDWMYGKHGILAYTIELGYNSFIPPEEELLGIVADNIGANLFVIDVADDPERRRLVLEHVPFEDTTDTGGYDVSVRVSGGELRIGGLTLYYRIGSGDFEPVVMDVLSGTGEYEATIPGGEPGQEVSYYFVAESVGHGTTFLPAYGPYEVFTFEVLGEGSSSAAAVVPAIILLAVLVAGLYIYRKRRMTLHRKVLSLIGLRFETASR
jgi:hypothetical protein